jgi:hypothetical protein
MKWHNGNSLPNIETDTALCVVQYRYPAPDYITVDSRLSDTHYDIFLFHKDVQSFSKPEDTKCENCLRKDLVIRWAYIEEDDDVYQEQDALEAVYSAVKHVKFLFNYLLTDGICCGKEYRNLIGLNELDILQEKVSKRISYLDSLE